MIDDNLPIDDAWWDSEVAPNFPKFGRWDWGMWLEQSQNRVWLHAQQANDEEPLSKFSDELVNVKTRGDVRSLMRLLGLLKDDAHD